MKAVSFVVFLALMAGAGFFGSRFPPGEWYAGLAKPSFNPPNWVFAPVWTALYIAIAVAGWRVWLSAGPSRRLTLGLWLAQWALNAIWSYLFFGIQKPGWALVEIVLLFFTIVLFMVLAHPLSRAASALFLPYALWVGFATVINGALWQLNRG